MHVNIECDHPFATFHAQAMQLTEMPMKKGGLSIRHRGALQDQDFRQKSENRFLAKHLVCHPSTFHLQPRAERLPWASSSLLSLLFSRLKFPRGEHLDQVWLGQMLEALLAVPLVHYSWEERPVWQLPDKLKAGALEAEHKVLQSSAYGPYQNC